MKIERNYNLFLTNTKFFNNQKKNNHIYFDNNNYDIISFKGKNYNFKMLNYYKNITNNYEPKSLEERAFTKLLLELLETSNDSLRFKEKTEQFVKKYIELENKLLDKDYFSTDKLNFLFASLIEALDKSKNSEQSSLFTEILFNNFLDTFGNENSIKESIKFYSEFNLLERPLIKSLLEDFI